MRSWLCAALGVAGLTGGCDRADTPVTEDPAVTASSGSLVDGAGPPLDASSERPRGSPEGEAARAHPDAGPPAEAALARWMDENAAPALRQRDLFAVAAAFDAIARFAPSTPPPAFANWASIATDGAAAARAAHLEGAIAACRACHTQYRLDYRSQLRARPLP
jgi:hypothetical protein